MMTDVYLEYVNEVHCRVSADAGIIMEMSEHFTHFKENYKFDPKFKNKVWDGKIRLLNRMTCYIYRGLALRVKKWCDANGYTFSFDDRFMYDNVSVNEVNEHLDSLNLPDWLDRREYQVEAIVKCLRTKRRLLLSPTSSGKSFMIYAIATWYKLKTLIIVPTTGLVRQMESDFRSYGFTGTIHTSEDGLLKDNHIKADMVITTWQSIDNGKRRVSKDWFDQFGVVFGDEAHGAKAATMIKIMSSMEHTQYRFGTTGTLDNNTLNQLTIEGLFGPPHTTTTTRELIDEGYASDIKIKCIVLRYPEEVRKEFNKLNPQTKKRKTYPEEIDFLVNNEMRNKFIKNLILSLEKNKLVFFRLKDHGGILYDMLKDHANVFYIDGGVKDRETIRHAIEDEENAVLIASLGTTSTGVSINRLKHMIAAHPSKAKIKLLQSIGRMLRMHEEKAEGGAILYDLVDDLSRGNNKNFSLRHFEERAKIYDAEKFDYKIYNVGLK